MRRLACFIPMLLSAALAAGPTCAQGRKDKVMYRGVDKVRTITGSVLTETWRRVEVDTDEDGVADVVLRGDQVRRIIYGNLPTYILRANLEKRKAPKRFIKLLTQTKSIYNDTDTPRRVRQHAYYDVATAYAKLARKGERGMLEKSVEAFNRLFRDIPSTRYAVEARLELGKLYLELGKNSDAVSQFRILAEGDYGPKVVRLSKLMAARVELALGRWAQADALLAGLAGNGKMGIEVELLRSRALVGQGKLPQAWTKITAVLRASPGRKMLGMSYCVLGDYFVARNRSRTALVAYLRVLLMYPETDSSERTRAVKQAKLMLRKLGRSTEAATLERRIGR